MNCPLLILPCPRVRRIYMKPTIPFKTFLPFPSLTVLNGGRRRALDNGKPLTKDNGRHSAQRTGGHRRFGLGGCHAVPANTTPLHCDLSSCETRPPFRELLSLAIIETRRVHIFVPVYRSRDRVFIPPAWWRLARAISPNRDNPRYSLALCSHGLFARLRHTLRPATLRA